MAVSVLLIVGDDNGDRGGGPPLLWRVIKKASEILRGKGPSEMGPVINAQLLSKIAGYIKQSENEGVEILLNGWTWTTPSSGGGGGGNNGGGGGGGGIGSGPQSSCTAMGWTRQ
jgi:hypothetical protein